MRIAVLKEMAAGESRVSATPETIGKFAKLGASLAVEADAGAEASISDEAYREAGAEVGTRDAVIVGADIILGVQAPEPASIAGAKPGAWVTAIFDPFRKGELVSAYASAGLEALAMDFMPRITRAQSMDVLSSQSNLAGYKAVIAAADTYGRAFPMMMTAAGTITAARVFVMGVGVAGLQAIATARRLGAVVEAFDVRPAVKEQVESLGGKFVAAKKGRTFESLNPATGDVLAEVARSGAYGEAARRYRLAADEPSQKARAHDLLARIRSMAAAALLSSPPKVAPADEPFKGVLVLLIVLVAIAGAGGVYAMMKSNSHATPSPVPTGRPGR